MLLKSLTLVSSIVISTFTGIINDPATTPIDETPSTMPTFSGEPTASFPYDMTYPYAYFELDELLKNVSGLTPSLDAKSIMCIQNEDGKAYMVDKKTGKINSSIFFVTEGQFEGVEMVGDTMFAMKDNGQMYKVWGLNSAHKTVKQVKMNLPRTEMMAGLGYDLKRNRLLISVKGQKEGEFSKKIYEFDVKTNKTNPVPAYDITLAQFKEFLADKKGDKTYQKLTEDFVSKANPKNFDFSPSSVAVNPLDGNIYVLSSMNNVLLVMNPQGKILEINKLKRESHISPNGICFDEEGTMYISNESKDGKPAKLFEYKAQKTLITASRR